MTNVGLRWVLAARPGATLRTDDFALEEFAIPELSEGEVRVAVEYHTIAPGIRPKLTADTYVPAIAIGGTIPGLGVGVVEDSRDPNFSAGDRVSGELGWASRAIMKGKDLYKLDPRIFTPDIPISAALDVLGVSGLTAYFGLLRVGDLRPGDVVLVSSAAGAVGSIAGQIARLKGCDTVGIAGSAEKCALLTADGFAAAIDYTEEPDLTAAIKQRRPDGIDLYFDNVGGETTDAAIANMRPFGRVVICGRTSDYGGRDSGGVRRMMDVLFRRLRIQGFIMYDFASEFEAARAELAEWLRQGKMRHRVTAVDGIENAAASFVSRFEKGSSIVRPLVKVGVNG